MTNTFFRSVSFISYDGKEVSFYLNLVNLNKDRLKCIFRSKENFLIFWTVVGVNRTPLDVDEGPVGQTVSGVPRTNDGWTGLEERGTSSWWTENTVDSNASQQPWTPRRDNDKVKRDRESGVRRRRRRRRRGWRSLWDFPSGGTGRGRSEGECRGRKRGSRSLSSRGRGSSGRRLHSRTS